MNPSLILGLFGIGIIAGLRAFTPLAIICWATHFGWLNLSDTRLSFLGSSAAIGISSLLALGELVADKLPMTPNRISLGPLSGRIFSGVFTATAVATALHQSITFAIILGIAGALAGTFGGYYVRRSLTKGYKLPDIVIALTEDLVAIVGGFCLVRQIVLP